MVQIKRVYAPKKNGQGMVIRNKARPIAKGVLPMPGVDFNKVISTGSKCTTLCRMITSSVKHIWKRSSLDVKNVFVNADLKEQLRVTQLEGFIDKGMDEFVYWLRKKLCGLRQASREWYIH